MNHSCPNRSRAARGLAASALALIALTAVPGCAVVRDQQSASEYLDDAELTARIKSQLLSSNRVEGTEVNVDVYEGRVTLSGWADNAAEKNRAEQIARNLKGVKGVQNDIRIKDEESS